MRKIFIRRKEAQGYLPKEIRIGARIYLGSIYVGRQPLKGVEGEEAKQLLPDIIGLPHTHADFPAKEKEFWAGLRIKVPFEGKELDITTDEDGVPSNPQDYVTYKWCQKHSQVAESVELMNSQAGKKFYIFDPQKDVLKRHNKIQVSKEADLEFLKASKEPSRLKRLLRVLTSGNPDTLTSVQIENDLYEFKGKSPAKFLKAAKDKDLDLKDEIAEMIQNEVLRKIGNQHIHEDETLGENLTDTLIYFKNKKNSGAVNVMRAKLKEVK